MRVSSTLVAVDAFALTTCTFAISGPNGSGKSGVIDAIEFAITGEISRLTGTGTKSLSLSEHGPHVDVTKFPDAAFVELRVFLPELNKSATITRTLSTPTKPKIEPADEDVKAALDEIASHPEIMLSRREILRFILTESSKRSEEIQTLLKLEVIGQTRAALNTAQNKLRTLQHTAETQVESSRNSLLTHLQLASLRSEDLLGAVNQRRKLLDLPEIATLTPDTKLDTGLSTAAARPGFNKQTALRDLGNLSETAAGFPDLARSEVEAILADLDRLERDPALLAAVHRRAFFEKGLELVDGPDCPLCDTPWEDEQRLRDHLRTKLAKSTEAQKMQRNLEQKGTIIAQAAIRIDNLLAPNQKIAHEQEESTFANVLRVWREDLTELKTKVTNVAGIMATADRLKESWLAQPPSLSESLQILIEKVKADLSHHRADSPRRL